MQGSKSANDFTALLLKYKNYETIKSDFCCLF